jgi:hypothetical protein
MAIQSTSLTLATSNIYVSSGSTVVSVMYFCNQGASAANLNVWVTSAGSTFGAANLVYREIQLAAADTYVVDMEKLVLGNDDQIKANISSGTSMVATVSYVGI